MKPLINFLEALATSAVILVVVTRDPWWTQSTIGLLTLGAVLTVAFYAFLLCGLSEGVGIGKAAADDAIYRIGKADAAARHRQRSAKMAEKC